MDKEAELGLVICLNLYGAARGWNAQKLVEMFESKGKGTGFALEIEALLESVDQGFGIGPDAVVVLLRKCAMLPPAKEMVTPAVTPDELLERLLQLKHKVGNGQHPDFTT